ncbi:MAG: hypothetical protein SPL58_07015 [Bacteroidaceae bacterium]|nr:hypothetical protein [Bacteroidaceae bacterium]
MKQLLISSAIVCLLMLTACDGKKVNNGSIDTDSIAAGTTDSTSMTATPAADLHTEEAIKAQITAYYNELNNVNDGVMNMTLLDSIACTKSLLALMEQVEEKNMKAIAQGSDAYFEDEGYRWFQGLGTPIKVQFDNITDPTQDYVEAFLTLSWNGQKGQVRLRLTVEDGQWKINDFADYDLDGVGFRRDMESFLGINLDDPAG